jgi:Acetyltransferase (GNAT) domain
MPATNCDAPDGPRHPLAELVLAAAAGQFPAADGGWRRLAPWQPGLEAVVAFTGHAVLCVADDVEPALLDRLGVDGLGGAHAPRVLTALAGPDGWISSLDVVVVRLPTDGGMTINGGGPALVERPDLAGETRVAYASRLRDGLEVYGYSDLSRSAVAVVGRGLARLDELSYELEPDRRGRGEGSSFVQAALHAIGGRAPLLACAAPGNAASLRVLLRCGFVPIASVQLIRRRPGYVPSMAGHEGD